MWYTIKLAAQKANLSPNVLRYYEKEGLLLNIKRSESGIRQYSEEDMEWLGLICCLKNTGMSIKQIRDFVNLSIQGPETLKERCEMLIAHKQDVEERIKEMNWHLEKVSHKIAYFTMQYKEYSDEEDSR
ncbi:DNA-binding transcriptional MerR regulator [Ruminiclostridium sufflavum DSM 19573]|uniref:DNA-binding transcriptional MerR regulator n=1 Tax=Ruminiclostridium sufflavum DSM 19573 TaxID=1121337 RepID=A0A318XL64_9FIRM|nr:MerR family transcriptional regulator [Ruminiclostridium sufflavum]PYG85834.1 DNA-binding transcriptional MerR regulator [Ruminiclostridium sufflavum DSM 19573]